MAERLLTEYEVHALGGPSVSSLQKQRVRGNSIIPFVRVGRLVRYKSSDVDAYIASLPSFRSTAEADSASDYSKWSPLTQADGGQPEAA